MSRSLTLSVSLSFCLSLAPSTALLKTNRQADRKAGRQAVPGSSRAPEGGPLADAASYWPQALKPAPRLMIQKHNHACTQSKKCVFMAETGNR